MKRLIIITLSVFILVVACAPQEKRIPPKVLPTETPGRVVPTPRFNVPTAEESTVTPEATATGQETSSATEGAGTEIVIEIEVSNEWMTLPVLPQPGANVGTIYAKGRTLGNDPNAFSIFGDCQTQPEVFMGVYETDPDVMDGLPPELQQAVQNFTGSFNRQSSTTQDGTTPGALLWDQWHRGDYGCSFGETPVECEVRIHRPSFVIIQIGSHFESRNTEYLRTIIRQLLDYGVVPILATKADNRELDNRINRDMALLSDEFDLPLWNFWAALSDLPDRGLYVMEGREEQGAIYLNDEAKEIHRRTGLEALDIVWRKALGN